MTTSYAVRLPADGHGWPLVGRSNDHLQISCRLERADEPGVLLVGEAGVGKTRLLGSLARRCRAEGMNVVELAQALPGTAGRDTVLVIDDLDQLGPTAAALAHRLCATTRPRILATCRSEAVTSPVVVGFYRQRLVEARRLDGLDRSAVAELLSAVLAGPVDALSVDRLWRLTRGNPLFLRQLVETGTNLDLSDGIWRWRGPALAGQSKVGDLVTRRLASLTPAQHLALAYVAHAEPVALDTLEVVADLADLEFLEQERLIQIERFRGRLTASANHPLYGEVVRAATRPADRSSIYRSLVLATAGSASATHLQTVRWRLAAGDRLAPAEIVSAATEALDRCEAPVAEQLARHLPSDPAVRLVLARALVAQDKAVEAEGLLSNPIIGDPSQETAALRALNLFWNLRRPQEAAEVIAYARSTDGADAAALQLAATAVRAFGSRDASWHDLDAPHPPLVIQDAVIAGAADPLRAYLALFQGRPKLVADAIADGRFSAPRSWASMSAALAACRIQGLVMAGRLHEASELVAGRDSVPADGDGPTEAALLAFERGTCEAWSGRLGRALPHFREAKALVDDHVPFPILLYIGTELAGCLASLGRPAEARTVLEELSELLPAGLALQPHLEFTAIRLDAQTGDVERSAARAEALAMRYQSAGRYTNAVEAFYYATRLRPTLPVATALRSCVQHCDSDLFRLMADHADAAATNRYGEVFAVAIAFEGQGYYGMALEAAVQAARLAAAAGEERDATRFRVHAARLRQLCDEPRTPWLVYDDSPSVPLSAREREVCELAARGVDNDLIAERLGLTRKTIANHLHRAYKKLGVRGRDQLRDVLGPAPERVSSAGRPPR
ncbi:LuxR family transcriptional regulator [Kribbella sp. CA-293567]|uniref:LuxR C-terminal-related transcriptional regulator n=1 Tax=Kribbella sp. CA-293567 TaxID=3002436 RepID=UPI0022DE801D|nr:LuxR family transcriptional regulator [Kribbella sp. CA-293567]WBQ03613.1 LuxR C-terminal-related transcriptional regulator [Kribbella sp. CA-293567]